MGLMVRLGPHEPDEEDEGLKDHFMGTLTLLMRVQLGSQETFLPTLPSKSPCRDPNHRMSKEDAVMPVTTGIGIMTQMQDVHPAVSCTREDFSQGMLMLSVNIVVLSEVRQLPTIMEDLNIAGLVAPQQTGETTQRYEQCHAVASRYQGSPAPAFFRQAGERSEQRMEQVALPNIKMQLEPEEELLVPLPMKKLKRIPMAKKLEDRIAYQQLCNDDLSKKGGSCYALQAQQGVTPGNTKKNIYVLFFFTSVSIENKKSISFDILEDTLKVYLSVAFLKAQNVFL